MVVPGGNFKGNVQMLLEVMCYFSILLFYCSGYVVSLYVVSLYVVSFTDS